MSNLNTHRTRIAIVGGGLAGTTLANALLRMNHLDVHIFEADAGFSERGAAIGISSTAQFALRHIIPSADELLTKAGAVPMRSSRTMIVRWSFVYSPYWDRFCLLDGTKTGTRDLAPEQDRWF